MFESESATICSVVSSASVIDSEISSFSASVIDSEISSSSSSEIGSSPSAWTITEMFADTSGCNLTGTSNVPRSLIGSSN